MSGFAGLLFVAAVGVVSVSAQTATSPNPKIERRVETRIFGPELDGGSYIGVGLRDISQENFTQYGLSDVRGVAIDNVSEGSPAAKAGLQKGDVVIRFNGEGVTSARKLQRLVSEVAPDHKVKLTVMRGGVETEIDVTVGRREPSIKDGAFQIEGMPNIQVIPEGDGEFNLRIPRIDIPGMPRRGDNRVILRGPTRQIGVTVLPLNRQLADYFGVSDGKGLLVQEVADGSAAAKAGLKAGDVIVSANGTSTAETQELVEAINAVKDTAVNLNIVRNKKTMSVKVTPEAAKEDGGERKIERVIINGPIS